MKIEDFVKRAQLLFSAKSNRGKLVANPIDRLHYYKQVVIGVGLVLLLGYSRFREDFDCHKFAEITNKQLINFCWINGTSTIVYTNERAQHGHPKQVS